jgi:hypothetical protein
MSRGGHTSQWVGRAQNGEWPFTFPAFYAVFARSGTAAQSITLFVLNIALFAHWVEFCVHTRTVTSWPPTVPRIPGHLRSRPWRGRQSRPRVRVKAARRALAMA